MAGKRDQDKKGGLEREIGAPMLSNQSRTKNSIHQTLLRLEGIVDRLRPKRISDEKTMVRCFFGYGTTEKIVLRGRVEQIRTARKSIETDSRRRNFLNMASNFFSKEIPHAVVHGQVLNEQFEATCDEEGYFHCEILISTPPAPHLAWTSYSAEVILKEPRGTPVESLRSSGMVQLCPDSAKRLIISDIDDTVIETGAVRLWELLKTTLLENAHTRRVFPGVSNLYRKLQSGVSGEDRNPIFYVTSSPWNLRDFILEVFDLRATPPGPLFMTDWGLGPNKLLKKGHKEHKLVNIQNLLNLYSPLPAILIGDSGEKDPEIYSQIVDEFSDRIEAIYIRDVSDHARDQEVRNLAEACAENHVRLLLIADTESAILDATERGFIA